MILHEEREKNFKTNVLPACTFKNTYNVEGVTSGQAHY